MPAGLAPCVSCRSPPCCSCLSPPYRAANVPLFVSPTFRTPSKSTGIKALQSLTPPPVTCLTSPPLSLRWIRAKAKVKCTYRQTALSVATELGPEGDVRFRGVLSVVFETPEMHIPPWYWFSITTTVHQSEWLVSGNCIGEPSGSNLACKLTCSQKGTVKIPSLPTVVVILPPPPPL